MFSYIISMPLKYNPISAAVYVKDVMLSVVLFVYEYELVSADKISEQLYQNYGVFFLIFRKIGLTDGKGDKSCNLDETCIKAKPACSPLGTLAEVCIL